MKPYADNVLLVLEPLPTMTAGGLHLPQQTKRGARGSRYARVVASGPGHYAQKAGGAGSTIEQPRRFIANETKPGDRVIVDSQAGQVWDPNIELSIPRHNPGTEFSQVEAVTGELRCVREQEILAIVDG